ncbi:MAG: site-specific integrase [Methanomassiliicoccales archaeon]|nr:site-specific integrase [Methanomassiliicoccales archaeon]
MAYHNQWQRAMGGYLNEMAPFIGAETRRRYRIWLSQAGDLVGWVNPKQLTLTDMRRIESEIPGTHNTKSVRCHVARKFLRWAGNLEAQKWRILSKQMAKMDGVFLTEHQVAMIREIARGLGTQFELIFSLGVDNGLRSVDMSRLKISNAQQLLANGSSMIIGKGRNGGKPRLLTLSEMTFRPLTEYMKHRDQLLDAYQMEFQDLFLDFNHITRRVYALKPENIQSRVIIISEASGIYFRSHDQRKTFGNRHWRIGTPLETIARMMGHESVDQTFKAYIGVQISDMLEAQRKLANLAPPRPVQM